mmetsp:Transcript_30249/g.76082  ORF Transcript_30249/g.76082 Transcript_30249/m.76082 type:complete len:248 (+) Transcript_30249:123-866(+)
MRPQGARDGGKHMQRAQPRPPSLAPPPPLLRRKVKELLQSVRDRAWQVRLVSAAGHTALARLLKCFAIAFLKNVRARAGTAAHVTHLVEALNEFGLLRFCKVQTSGAGGEAAGPASPPGPARAAHTLRLQAAAPRPIAPKPPDTCSSPPAGKAAATPADPLPPDTSPQGADVTAGARGGEVASYLPCGAPRSLRIARTSFPLPCHCAHCAAPLPRPHALLLQEGGWALGQPNSPPSPSRLTSTTLPD